MEKNVVGVENHDTAIDKYSVLKWIFDRIPVRHNDELSLLLKDLRDKKSYKQLDLINSLYLLVLDNVLQNISELECVKIIIEK